MILVSRTIFLICFIIPIIKAVSLRIDGLIDLGPKWTYEYRIVDVDGAKNKNVGRAGNIPEDESNQQHYTKVDDQMKRDEERLRNAEERLRQQAAELRNNEPSNGNGPESNHKTDATALTFLNHDNPRALKEHIISQNDENKSEVKKEIKKPTPLKESVEIVTSHKADKVTFSSASEEDSFYDSSDVATAKMNTMFELYDFTSTRKPKKVYNDDSEEITTVKHKNVVKYEDSITVEDNFTEQLLKQPNIGRIHDIETVATANVRPLIPIKGQDATTQSIINSITTIRTDDIYTNPHKVKDDAKVTEFINQLFKQTQNTLDRVKEKAGQYHVRKEIDILARNYEEKFKEFLKETNSKKIKTRLGTQKVILNTIEMSNRILKRLVNFMIGDMDKKGLLRNNLATANIFQKEIEKEQNLELSQACKKFGICRAGQGFPEFISDVIIMLLRCDDKRLKQSVDALTEVVKGTNYNKVLDSKTERRLKDGIENLETQSVYTLRPTFMIIRNIILNKNKPLVVNNLSANRQVNGTLAFLEIIDMLDQKLPRTESNALEWSDIKNSLSEFADSKRYDIQDIMEAFVRHLKKSLKSLDKPTQRIVSKNINVILGYD